MKSRLYGPGRHQSFPVCGLSSIRPCLQLRRLPRRPSPKQRRLWPAVSGAGPAGAGGHRRRARSLPRLQRRSPRRRWQTSHSA